MKKYLFIMLLIGLSANATAEMICSAAGTACSNVVVTGYWVRSNGQVLVRVDGDIPTSCRYGSYNLQLKEDGTDADNRMFSSFLTFVSQHKKLNIRFTPAEVSLRGSDSSTGCTATSPATITSVIASFDAVSFGADVDMPAGDENLP